MITKIEKSEENMVKIQVTVPASKFDEAVLKAYKKNAVKFNIPGFRKGKAPKHMIEKMYGKEVFFQDAENDLFEETYPQAIDENNIAPIDYPKIDVVQGGDGLDFVYTATVEVRPVVKLGEYKNVEVKKVVEAVTDESIQQELDSMREKNARIVNKEEDTLANGDIAVIDFEGFVDGVAFEGGKAENYELALGAGTFIPGFEEQLVGAKLNSEVDVNVTFPEEYQSEQLKGKPALFKVIVNAIKVKELPNLDDEFTKDVSEFDTLDELKADIRSRQEKNNEEKATKEMEDELVNKVVEVSEVKIPDIMVEREVDYMVKDLDNRLKYQSLDINKYIEILGTTIEALKNDFKEMALTRVKTNLVLEAVGEAEKLEVSKEELEKRAEEIAMRYGTKDMEKMKASILASQIDIIKEELVNNKVIDFLVKSSVIA